MQKELDSIKAEKRSLQMKMLSTEHDSALLAERNLPEDLQAAYAELRRTQHTVVQQERLRALGQMASGIAHDINNALCPVLTFSDLLLTEPSLSPDSRKRLRHIRTAGDDIARLVSRMRDFYRRRTSHDELAPVNVPDVVEQVVELTRPRWRDMAQRNGVTIHLETKLDSNLPLLQSQEMELREALTNMVLNSVEAMPSGGTITVSARIKDGPVGKDGTTQARLVLEVADTGVGMTEDVRKRCLEPFFSTKEQRGGSGLGLAMVYGIVQRHDGKIEIDSEEGRGTCIRLCFPISATKAVTPVVSQPVSKFQPLRILCIDDEPVLREMLEQVLQVNGHEVAVAADGKEGVNAFTRAQTGKHPFDVVITDLGMPVMDGLDVARQIRASSPRTPIVLLTGWGTLLSEDAAQASTFDAILSKPTRVPELLSALAKATNQFGRNPMGALAA
jgi:signal transduction histidine kinase/ActR/RegA family two-component response regulator